MRNEAIAQNDVIPLEEMKRRAAALVPELRAAALATERNRRVSSEMIEKIRAAEIFKTLQPRRWGGFEYGFSAMIEMGFELGRGCGSTAWCASLTLSCQWFLGCYPRAAQEEVWGRNREHVAVAIFAPTGKAERVEGGYRVSGSWPFFSNIDNVEWAMLACLFTPDGAERPIPGFFLVPRTEYDIEDTWFTAGLAGTGSKTAVIEQPVFVPDYRKVAFAEMASGNPPGSDDGRNPLYKVPFMSGIPMSLAAPAVGIALGAIEDFTEQVRIRTLPAGADRGARMADYPNVQSRLGEAAAAVDAALLLLRRDARELEEAVALGRPISVDLRVRNRRDQGYAVKLAAQAVTLLFETSGGAGLALDNPVQRAWRDVNAIARHIGVNWDVMSQMYGQRQFGLEPRGQY
jgi:alkylation response protein AidB-like acyl-CoA dehydrogenase